MTWTSEAYNAAKRLVDKAKHVTAAGMTIAAISSADIDRQATAIMKNYPNVTTQQIKNKIEEDIKTLRR